MNASKYALIFVLILFGTQFPMIAYPSDEYDDYINISPTRIQQRIPYRDDLGDVLEEFELRYDENAGLAWDGELIWGTCRTGERRLWAMNPENHEIVHDFPLDMPDAIGMTYDYVEGLIWICEHVNPNGRSRAHLYDREGEFVRQVELPSGGHVGLAFDGEFFYGNCENSQQNQRIYRFTREGEVLDEGPNIRTAINRGRCVSICYAGAHEEGQIWAMATGYIAQLDIDWDENSVEVVRGFNSRNQDYPHQGIVHDDFNLWAGGNWRGEVGYVYDDGIEETYGVLELNHEMIEFGPAPSGEEDQFELRITNATEGEEEHHVLEYEIEDLGEDPDWLQFEPAEGTVEPRESVDVAFTAVTEGLELGEYDRSIQIRSNDPDRRRIEIPVHLFVVEGFGLLHGTVANAENDEPVAGALVTVDYFGFEATTDDEGAYAYEDIPSWTYDLIITREDFLPVWIRELEVGAGEEVIQNIELLHSECRLTPDRIDRAMPADDELEITLALANPGNGALTWSVERIFPGGGAIDPWEFRYSFAAGDSVEDTRLGGIEFDGERFYISGGNNGEMENLVYIFDDEGNYIDRFPQFAESRYGMRDLAWDGELLWGVDDRTVYGFTTGGELVHELESPVGNARCIAFDSERELLWICNITTDIGAIDREGNQAAMIDRPDGARMYGLAWFPEDPDGYNLYLFTSGGENEQQVVKVNVEDGESMIAGDLWDVEGARAGGATITGLWDPYSWAFVSMLSSPDVAAIWQLAPRTDWLAIEPVEGVVEANEEIELAVTLNTLGLPEDEQFNADLRFTHDGVGGVTDVPISLQITGEGGLSRRVLRCELGWNLVSLNIDPPEHSVIELMAPLVEEDLLIMMKDSDGRFYAPEFDFNSIPGWNSAEGYLVKVRQECELGIEGEVIAWDTPIDLVEGWQLISYYPRASVDVRTAFANIRENLIIAKDGYGRFYVAEYDFTNMDNLTEGQGYQLKMSADDEFVYSLGDNDRIAGSPNRNLETIQSQVKPTGNNMSLLLIGGEDLAGATVQAFSESDLIVGVGVFDPTGRCGLAIWGDDPATEQIDGLIEGEEYTLYIEEAGKRLSPSSQEVAIISGENFSYEIDGFIAVNLNIQSEIPDRCYLAAAYPNPFNSTARIEFGLPEESEVRIEVFDISGRSISTLIDGRKTAGIHDVEWNGENTASGLYLIRMKTDGFRSVRKVMMLR